ncbi:transcription factor IIA subunit alpha [Malassezia sp. CBS 17886]|nr:transcription factor IIA subunit alpha [Malassezia sp. CBS 17886]
MSNRVVSLTFRHIIDDVIANVRQDFEDMGIEKEVVEELQRSWEAKLVATQVTEFEGAANSSLLRTTYGVVPPSMRQAPPKPEPAKPETSASPTAKAEAHDDAGAGTKRKRDADEGDSNEIGSDLDDSDDDDGEGNEDMMLCLYDKCYGAAADACAYFAVYMQVQRVKNKWKCVLRDGVASIGGRDYLFSKCNGEFEW